jgi:hypothetical protein
MNGKDPVKLLYTIPSLLSANAPNQNTFAMDLSSSAMMYGMLRVRIGRAGWMMLCGAPRLAGWILMGIRGTGVTCGGTGVAGIFVVLQMPCLGRFM